MFSFVYGGECGMCGMPNGECVGHAGVSGVTDINLLKAVCDTEVVSYRDADAEIGMTTDDIESLLDSGSDVWSVLNSDSVSAISDGAARTVAMSFVTMSDYTRSFKQLGNGEEFGIVELMNDCDMLISGANSEEIDALTALAYWAWEKIENGLKVACANCGESPCYVFSLSDIGMEEADGCSCRAPYVVKNA